MRWDQSQLAFRRLERAVDDMVPVVFATDAETIAGASTDLTVNPAGFVAGLPHIDVRTFGTVGDGATDDTAAVQAALTTANNGTTIVFPSGRYLLTGQISWTGKRLHLVGLGRAVLVQGATLTVPLLAGTTVNDSTIDGLVIEGNETISTWDGAQSDRDGICITTSDKVAVRNVVVTGKSVAIRFDTCTNSVIDKPVITGFGEDGIASPNWHWAVAILGCTDTQVIGVRATSTGSGVINGSSGFRTTVDGGSVTNCWDNAIYISSGDYSIVRGVNIHGPVVTTSARPGGIKVRGNGHVVANNVIRRVKVGVTISSAGVGATPDSLGATGFGSICSGNFITDTTLDGINIATGTESGTSYYPRHCRIIGNTIENSATSGGTQAAIRGTAHGCQIIGNIIDTCGGTTAMVIMAGILADTYVPTINGVVISDNTFVNSATDCMRLSLMASATITNNTCIDSQVADLIDCRTVTASLISGNHAPSLGRVVRLDSASTTNRVIDNLGAFTITDNNYVDLMRASDPNTALIPASVGSIYRRTDGSTGTTLYVKESGTSTGGWALAKTAITRVSTLTTSGTPAINTDTTDLYTLTALAVAVTSFTTNLTGTPTDGQRLAIAITDNGTARAITWGAKFEAPPNAALPATTVASQRLDVEFIWNTVTSKWRLYHPDIRQPRVSTVTSSATPPINSDNVDLLTVTALAVAITSFTTNLTGTPVDGQVLKVAITDNGTARAITWGASFEASTVALPTTTVISTRLDVEFVWNAATSKWRCQRVS